MMNKLVSKKLKHMHHINQNLKVRWDLELNENVKWLYHAMKQTEIPCFEY